MKTGKEVRTQRLKPVTRPSAMRGITLIRAMLLVPAALLALLLLAVGFFEGRKAYWDYRVQQMCEKDGGTRIHEHELITRQEAQENGLLIGGELVIPPRPERLSNNGYYIDYESVYLRTGAPSVFRSRSTAVRARDRKVLAEMVSYSRVGGDFPTFAHPSAMSCSDANAALTEFRTTISIKEEKK
ncbi:MAG: hypothetical protein R3E35_04950 [Rhodocyclaceae bacterium]